MRAPRWVDLSLALMLLASVPAAAGELLAPGKAFRARAKAVDARTVTVRFEIAPGYYLYRDKFRFAVEPGALAPAAVDIPRGATKEDPFFGRVETFRRNVSVRLTLPESVGRGPVTIVADSQGCADIGVCFPPFRQELSVTLSAPRPGRG
jgi:thiol:disulfide interchange protein DsbD